MDILWEYWTHARGLFEHHLVQPYHTDEPLFLHNALTLYNLFGICSFTLLALGVTAPYGRYSRGGVWGFLMPAKLAWVLQEAPALVIPLLLAYRTPPASPVIQCLLAMFTLHYFNRTVVYPLRIKGGKPTPVTVFLMAFGFCAVNGYLIGKSLVQYRDYPTVNHVDSLQHPQFLLGCLLFFVGMQINWSSDAILRGLRKDPKDTGYKIPHGGMFSYVSGANFFGEMVEWLGFALAANTVFAYSFALFTALNIGPRAYQHHQWYLSKFKDYPKDRKAVIPFLI